MIWRGNYRQKQHPKTSVGAERKEPWGYEFYEGMYKAEVDLREKMPARLATSTAITVAVFGALAFMLREYAAAASFPARNIFWVFFSLSCLALAWSLYYLTRFWWGNEYKLMPTAIELHRYHEVLKGHYGKYDGADSYVAEAFRDYLLGRYVECATHAAEANLRRSARLYKANGGLLLTSLLVLFTYGIFIVSTLHMKTLAPQPIYQPVRGGVFHCVNGF